MDLVEYINLKNWVETRMKISVMTSTGDDLLNAEEKGGKKFNEATDDGRNMGEVSELLSDAINSIINIKEESDIDSLFSAGETIGTVEYCTGLDDFELICFLVIQGI